MTKSNRQPDSPPFQAGSASSEAVGAPPASAASFDIDQIYEMLITQAYRFYSSSLNGTPHGVEASEQMRNFKPGDVVMELSTIHDRKRDAERMGVFVRELQKAAYKDWDEEKEGEPVPRERAWVIQTLSGKKYTWTNANFMRVLPTRSRFEKEASK